MRYSTGTNTRYILGEYTWYPSHTDNDTSFSIGIGMNHQPGIGISIGMNFQFVIGIYIHGGIRGTLLC